MTYFAAALFFTLVLLGAAVALHLTVRLYWTEMVLALRGEWGREVRAVAAPKVVTPKAVVMVPAPILAPRAAAF